MLKKYPSNITFNFELVKIFPKFSEIASAPLNFFFGEENIFPDEYCQDPIPIEAPEHTVNIQEAICKKWCTPILEIGLNALKIHTVDYLPGGIMFKKTPEEKERLSFVKATSNECESVFGFLTHLKKKYPHAKSDFLESVSKVKRNHFSLHDAVHVQNSYPTLVPQLISKANTRTSWNDTVKEGIEIEEQKVEEENEKSLKKQTAKLAKDQLIIDTPFITDWKEIKRLKQKDLILQWKKHKMVGHSNKKVSELIEGLSYHISGDRCLCSDRPFEAHQPGEYKGQCCIWIVDIETNHLGALMEICFIELITGAKFESLVQVLIWLLLFLIVEGPKGIPIANP